MRDISKKRNRLLVVAIIIVFFPFTKASATEVPQVETKGSIGFTGVYEPIGTPDPTPPESIARPPITEVAKPGGSLPQTNSVEQSWVMWLGAFLVSFVFFLWKRKNKKLKLKKAGIIT